jgi:hypothetical protein
MAENEHRRYQVPTHLKTDDHLTIGFFTFTFRQLLILVLGGGAAWEVGTQFPSTALASLLGPTLTTVLEVGSLALLVPLTLALAFVRHRGRPLESWLFVWLNYLMQPKAYRWRQQPERALSQATIAAPLMREEGEEA